MRKLLKHDFKSVFNQWWITSLAALLFTVIGILCVRANITNSQQLDSMIHAGHSPSMLQSTMRIVYSIGEILSVLALVAYGLFMLFAVLRRYYTNLFTDQGYLTFTLPVSRQQIVRSKLITGFTYAVGTGWVISLCILGYTLFTDPDQGIINMDFVNGIRDLFISLYTDVGPMATVYIMLFMLCILAFIAMSVMLYYTCITVGSLLVKRAKIWVGIAIYYAFNTALTYICWIMFVVIIDSSFLDRLSKVEGLGLQHTATVSIFILILSVIVLAAYGLYMLSIALLNRKLNLA